MIPAARPAAVAPVDSWLRWSGIPGTDSTLWQELLPMKTRQAETAKSERKSVPSAVASQGVSVCRRPSALPVLLSHHGRTVVQLAELGSTYRQYSVLLFCTVRAQSVEPAGTATATGRVDGNATAGGIAFTDSLQCSAHGRWAPLRFLDTSPSATPELSTRLVEEFQ